MESKNDILANLYTLRAGLSVIATEKQKTEDIEIDTNLKILDLESKTKALQDKEKLLQDRQNESYKKIRDKYDEISLNKALVDKGNPKKLGTILLRVLICIAALAVISGVIIGDFFLIRAIIDYNIRESNPERWTHIGDWILTGLFVLVCGGVGLAAIGAIIHFFIISGIKQDISNYSLKERNYRKAVKFLDKSPESEIALLQHDIETYKNEIALIPQEIALIPNKINEIKIDKNKSLVACYDTGSKIYKALQAQYTSMIDERDWGDLDLVIYAFETGRADSMKEALQFVDGERRANRILNAVEISGKQVCSTIQNGLRSLASGMVKCFQVLSEQIAENAAKQEAYISSIESRINLLTDKIDYENALLKQRNVSSQKLIEENKIFLSQAKAMMDAQTVKLRNNGGML